MRWWPQASDRSPRPSQARWRSLTTIFVVRCITIVGLRPHARLLPAVSVWLSLLAALASNATAQHRFDSWTTENGLPQNSVNDILQTRDGYLWLATLGGLVRFDGVRFVVFDRSVDGIGSQRLLALHEDRMGTLWAGTDDGMLIRYRNGQFITYAREDGLPHAPAVRIEEDDDGSLWVTSIGAITRFDGKGFVTFGSDYFAPGVSAPPATRYLDAWWSEDATGLHALVKGRVRTFPVRSELGGAEINRVTLDRRGTLWMSTTSAGVIKASDGLLERYTTRNGTPDTDSGGAFFEGHRGDFWFGDRAHLYRVKNGRQERIQLPGAPLSELRSFYVDREGSTWLGTTATGLHRLRDPLITVHSEGDGVSVKIAYSIFEDRTGAIWIGNGGLKRYANGRFTSYWSAEGVSPDRVTSIYEDKGGTLWVGTYGGLRSFRNGRFRPFDDASGFLKGGIWSVHEDRSGTFCSRRTQAS
jgi:ligand-binding sensor domain-containing protein